MKILTSDRHQVNAQKRMRTWSSRVKLIFVSHINRVTRMDKPCLKHAENPAKVSYYLIDL